MEMLLRIIPSLLLFPAILQNIPTVRELSFNTELICSVNAQNMSDFKSKFPNLNLSQSSHCSIKGF